MVEAEARRTEGTSVSSLSALVGQLQLGHAEFEYDRAIQKVWPVKELWRKTIELCRRHPVLWMPVIGAAILSPLWRELGKTLSRDVAISSMGGRSVLDGSSANSFSLPRWLFYVPAPACGIVDACCYVIAMLVTAKLLGRLLVEVSHAGPYDKVAKTTVKGPAFLLGLLVYLLSTGVSVLILLSVTSLATSTHRPVLMTSPYLIGAEIIPMYFALGYFLTPMALRLLTKSNGTLMDSDRIAMGRECSFLAGATITILSVTSLAVGRSLHTTPVQAAVYGFASTIISALPYTPLFVAFSCLALKNEDEQTFDVALSGEEQQEGA